MVAKQSALGYTFSGSLNLAKIHMVAKLVCHIRFSMCGLNLAKIHMVAKRRKN